MASLSASTDDPSPKTALRNRVTQGLLGALKACWKFSATGVLAVRSGGDLVDDLDPRVRGVLVVGQVGAGHRAVGLGEHFDLGLVGHQPGQEVPGLVADLGVLRDADAVAADEGRLAAV